MWTARQIHSPLPLRLSAALAVSVFALVSRGGCSFGQKAYHAQRAGASGMIVYNLESAIQFPLPHMTPGNVSNIDIPGMLINYQGAETTLRIATDVGCAEPSPTR